ncbi:MAG: class I SAM-dependent methyltransferase [Catenulispora sp.]|nr:class I SAM-dependent methyltransferase [Catenulispora sp.]NUR63857.1 class I SAM-dependent methyltransferase [Catenulispora sp.]
MAQNPVIGQNSVINQEFLRAFHQRNPGITEAVLQRAVDHGITPYRWLADAVPKQGTVLDLACGSAPMRRTVAPGCAYVGVDRSPAELNAAQRSGVSKLIRADAAALPHPDAVFDTVVCSMALMIAQPLDAVLAEIRRVLRPGGLLAATVPAEVATSAHAARLFGLLLGTGSLPRSPNNAALADAGAAFARHRLRLIGDEQRRFSFRVRTGADAQLLLDSLYLQGTGPARMRVLSVAVRTAAVMRPSVPIPIRRLIARAE